MMSHVGRRVPLHPTWVDLLLVLPFLALLAVLGFVLFT